MFETTRTIGQALVNNLTKLFDQYELRNKSIAYDKDEGSNLNTMTIALKFVMKCEVFLVRMNFFKILVLTMFWGKKCQYVTTNKKELQKSQVFSIKSS